MTKTAGRLINSANALAPRMSAARGMGPLQRWFCHEHGTTCLPLMGPPGWLVCQLWDRPGVARVLPVVGPLYWPNELPGGIGDRDRGNAAAVAAGVGAAGGGPAIGHRS